MGYEPIALTTAPRRDGTVRKAWFVTDEEKRHKGPPGFEPGTYRTAADCSTAELWTLDAPKSGSSLAASHTELEKRAATGIEPVTSCTQNRNHATRPSGRYRNNPSARELAQQYRLTDEHTEKGLRPVQVGGGGDIVVVVLLPPVARVMVSRPGFRRRLRSGSFQFPSCPHR
jgi:hypothetical protein